MILCTILHRNWQAYGANWHGKDYHEKYVYYPSWHHKKESRDNLRIVFFKVF